MSLKSEWFASRPKLQTSRTRKQSRRLKNMLMITSSFSIRSNLVIGRTESR